MTASDQSPSAHSNAPEPSKEHSRREWVIGLIAIILLVIGPIVIFIGVRSSVEAANADDAWSGVPEPPPHTDHSLLMPGPYETGSEVTEGCLECHEESGEQMLQSEHWLSRVLDLRCPDRPELIHHRGRVVMSHHVPRP